MRALIVGSIAATILSVCLAGIFVIVATLDIVSKYPLSNRKIRRFPDRRKSAQNGEGKG